MVDVVSGHSGDFSVGDIEIPLGEQGDDLP
jgi:hypothetical protein